ncbi:MAG: electron transport complex subunit RsxG [Gammaproteobacteria bacterium]|nr:electron transport complex subunit RsxG [Gammaproteobacteria bacterium]
MKRSLPVLISGALLGLFGIAGAGLVGFSHEATKARIEQNERDALLQQLQVLLPLNDFDNDLLSDTTDVNAPTLLGSETTRVYRGRKDGEPVAVVLNPVVTQGYSGAIKLIVAIRTDGTLSGVRVLGHRETPGLGDKIEARRSNWIDSFRDKSLLNPEDSGWKVRRDGGVFDQFTGATITPRAVVRGVRSALLYFNDYKLTLFEPASQPVAENRHE